MSAGLLCQAFLIRGYEYLRTEYQGGEVGLTVLQEPKTFRCEACGSRHVRPRGQVWRRFRWLPIGGRSTTVVFPTPRVACQACGVVRRVGSRRGRDVDFYGKSPVLSGPVGFGAFEPKSERFVLRAEVVGGNPAATGTRSFFGLDCVVPSRP